jgi:hypothetical protein
VEKYSTCFADPSSQPLVSGVNPKTFRQPAAAAMYYLVHLLCAFTATAAWLTGKAWYSREEDILPYIILGMAAFLPVIVFGTLIFFLVLSLQGPAESRASRRWIMGCWIATGVFAGFISAHPAGLLLCPLAAAGFGRIMLATCRRWWWTTATQKSL